MHGAREAFEEEVRLWEGEEDRHTQVAKRGGHNPVNTSPSGQGEQRVFSQFRPPRRPFSLIETGCTQGCASSV